MKKRAVLALAAALLLSLAGCGNGPASGSADTPSPSAPAAPANATEEFLKTITPETAKEKGVCGADLTWYYQDNVLVVRGSGDMTDYDDSTTTPNAPWHQAGIGTSIGHIYIEDGVTSIGDCAFSYWFPHCESTVSKAVIGKDVARIGRGAFDKCAGITLEFQGDAPEGLENVLEEAGKIVYSGSGFEPYAEQYPEIDWVKK